MRCQALHLSDEQRCSEEAQDSQNLFCFFHSRQCYGLYKGYKSRNAELDHLVQNPPPLLQGTQLHALKLSQINEEEQLQELYKHLFRRYVLLDRVIRARKLHHSRFYSLELDYGHEQFINQLLASRTPLLRALESTIQRIAEIRYDQQKWFDWVRALEEEDEQQRDTEKKRLKQENLLFQRHAKELKQRREASRQKEEQKRQQDYLEKTWAEQNAGTSEDDKAWDPIEETIEDERELYLDLLRHFLWKSFLIDTDQSSKTTVQPRQDQQVEKQQESSEQSNEANTKSKNARKKARQKANAKAAQHNEESSKPTPEKRHVESREQMKHRLKHPETYKNAFMVTFDIGTMKNEKHNRVFPLSDEEIDKVLAEISEIKELLFCRLLLNRASLLPAALRANSIREFLSDGDISNAELRDLCIRMEQPGLQEIRDACADLKRHEDETEEDDDDDRFEPSKEKNNRSLFKPIEGAIPSNMQTKREKALKKRRTGPVEELAGAFVDFGHIDDSGQFQAKRISVKVCGKTIYNYPSEKAMSRGGWFQFSILAKDSAASDAINLCRNWEEFFDLINLINLAYFPSTIWIDLVSKPFVRQLMTLTFIPYIHFEAGEQLDGRLQALRFSGFNQQLVIESRNFICAVMNRNNPITRRFIQYVAMRTTQMVMLVRDVSTGDVLVQPPDDQLWIVRSKVGMRRNSPNEWKIIDSVGPEFLEKSDQRKPWSLGFREYYDIIIWDLQPDEPFPELVNEIQLCLFKAIRYDQAIDTKRPNERVLRSIVWDGDKQRSREALDGERTLWDDYSSSDLKIVSMVVSGTEVKSVADSLEEWKYNEADRLEDEVLFPWEKLSSDPNKATGLRGDPILALQNNRLHKFENNAPDFERFVLDYDTDEEVSEGELEEQRAKLRKFMEKNPVHDHGSADASDTSHTDLDGNDNDYDYDEEDDDDDVSDMDEFFDEASTNLSPEEAVLEQEVLQAVMNWIRGSDTAAKPDDISSGETLEKEEAKEFMAELKERRQQQQIQDDFDVFMDRSRAAVFKSCWHAADLEPYAKPKWDEFQNLLKSWTEWEKTSAPPKTRFTRLKQGWELLAAMEIDIYHPPRMIRDMFTALDITDLFFDSPHEFLNTKQGHSFRECSLLKQEQRATIVPDRRLPSSCKTRPANQWKQWDEINKGNRSKWSKEVFPPRWNEVTRPIIAHLYREGVICSAYDYAASGFAVCMEEPTRPGKPDLFCDFRDSISDTVIPPTLTNPTLLRPLPEQARTYNNKHSGARFTVLKLWSAPHFWPLMIGIENRQNVSFIDGIGRIWQWKFVPKDMPYSEWSIHRTAQMRLEPFNRFFSSKRSTDGEVTLRKDMFLVKAKDETTLRRLTTAVIFAIQTRPWRLEIDPWKSWFNVDIGFIESLQSEWWD